MAVELTANALQTVQPNQNVLFTDTAVRCNKGYVVHREGAGIVTLRGMTSGNAFARYRLAFYSNVGVPTGGAAGPISLAFAINGEPVPTTTATITAPVGSYENLATAFFVDVPRGCCYTIAVENISSPAAAIDVVNANLMIERIA